MQKRKTTCIYTCIYVHDNKVCRANQANSTQLLSDWLALISTVHACSDLFHKAAKGDILHALSTPMNAF